MAEDVLITCLPDEVTELILENPSLELRDVVSFALSCKHLHRLVFASNKLWRTKFFQRWPLLREAYTEYETRHKIKNWLYEVQTRIKTARTLMHQLSLMSGKYYEKQELSYSQFSDWDPLFRPEKGAHPLAYHFLEDDIIRLIEPPLTNTNLTHRYYACKVIRYIKQSYLTDEWHRFTELPPQKQLLEVGATLVAQWSQAERRVTYSYISRMLDDIVDRAKKVLMERYPSHSIFNTPPETLEYWKSNNIDDNQWEPVETKQIMAALCEVMFNKLNFHGNSEMYYSSENSFIDRVLELKHGIPITLAIVFESICRRVGVKCEPINFPAHFLLRWKERYLGPGADEAENFYIDVFNGGQFLTRKNCPRIGGVSRCPIERYNIQNASTAVEVVERMANNLEVASRQRTHLNGRAARLRSALELLHMIRPHDTGVILHLARFYMFYLIDLAKLINILTYIKKDTELTSRGPANHILQMLQDHERHKSMMNFDDELAVKKRTPNVKYAIGMVMRHICYDYVCVITGWDLQYDVSPWWMVEMGVEELNEGANQPFYHVFVNDGSSRYAAQENLVMATSTSMWVNHDETGRYFSQFEGTHYVPNPEKAKEYPEDAAVRDHLLLQYSDQHWPNS